MDIILIFLSIINLVAAKWHFQSDTPYWGWISIGVSAWSAAAVLYKYITLPF